jgi:hypothetical protein
MKRQLIYFSLLCIPFYSHGQNQNVDELIKRNGYKGIRLGNPVDSIKGSEFKKDFIELKEFPAKLYEINNAEFMKVGEVEVNKVEVKVYNGLIYEIIVTAPKDPRIMRALEKLYGKPIYSLRSESYYWRAADQLSLVYKGHHKEIKLLYKSYPMIRMMYADKKKKLEEIAEDF